jgi:hypothetical protein
VKRHAGEEITGLAKLAGIRLDEAQQYVAEVTSGVGADDKWAAFEAVVFAPRQNLKTEFLLARILAGVFLFGEELIVYSAHRASTTTKTFGRLKRAIDKHPALGSRIARVGNRIGAEFLELDSGRRVEMVARSTSSGRGFTGDVVILDESHDLDGEQLGAILPMVATRRNPQVLYALSLGNEHTSHLGGLRKRALDGKPGVAWVEWSMDPDNDDVADRRVWAACNPAYPARIPMERLEKLFAALGPDRFAVEHLGKSEWPSGEPGTWQIISEDLWERARGDDVSLVDAVPASAVVPVVRPADWETWPDGVPPWVQRAG